MKFGFFAPKLPVDRRLCAVSDMYETQFGLNKRPFRALAKGSDVFVGPQTAAAMAGLKKALASPDAIVAVGGPVGVGKSTVVHRALGAIGVDQAIIPVGRMQLGQDEVLELLLEEMGVEIPPSTVRRFTTFRRQLKKYADDGARVFIVVEDAARLGPDALCELEALTASDSGVSEGANVVLMGDDGLDPALKNPQLARLRQRLRLRQNIAPLTNSELLGYLKHCFRLAGNEFDRVFENGSADVLHRLSGGIPRIANNLVESSLVSAVENKLERVNVAQIKLVASEEYDLSLSGEAPSTAVPEPVPVATEAPEPPPVVEAEPETDADHDIPELIQDTLPDLAVLSPELADSAAKQAVQSIIEKAPEPEPEPTMPHSLADDDQLGAAQVEQSDDAVPEWERDPTLAQLRPDLDALEQAMAVAQGLAPDPEGDETEAESTPEEPAEPVPEITLDREIQAKVDKATEQRRQEEARRAAAEAEAEKESRIDNRPTSVIIAEALEKKQQEDKTPDNSVEAQLDTGTPSIDVPDIYGQEESSDTVSELPVLRDATEPAFEPAAHRAAPAAPEPQSVPILEPAPAPAAPQPEPEPRPVPETRADLEHELELALESEPDPQPETAPASEAEPALQLEPDPEEGEDARKADAELEQIAVNLARARTIDDCDDKMAETLFGEEFSMMAAQVAANAPPELSANDDFDETVEESVEEPAPAPLPEFDGAAAVNVDLESTPDGVAGSTDTSASQRLATVRALNASVPDAPSDETGLPPTPHPEAPVEQPQSIEDQINTSMTQTFQSLSTRTVVNDDDDDDGKRKGGFLSRFRRS